MRKCGIILISLLILMGCSTKEKSKEEEQDYTSASTTLSGEEVEQKLGKIKIDVEWSGGAFHEDGTGEIGFYVTLQGYDEDLLLDFEYTDYKVSAITIHYDDYDEYGGCDSYTYYTKDNENYSYITYNTSEGYCQMAVDGKVDKKNKVCKSDYKANPKVLYNELCKRLLKQAGIIREDLITFGNYYYQKHKNDIKIWKKN